MITAGTSPSRRHGAVVERAQSFDELMKMLLIEDTRPRTVPSASPAAGWWSAAPPRPVARRRRPAARSTASSCATARTRSCTGRSRRPRTAGCVRRCAAADGGEPQRHADRTDRGRRAHHAQRFRPLVQDVLMNAGSIDTAPPSSTENMSSAIAPSMIWLEATSACPGDAREHRFALHGLRRFGDAQRATAPAPPRSRRPRPRRVGTPICRRRRPASRRARDRAPARPGTPRCPMLAPRRELFALEHARTARVADRAEERAADAADRDRWRRSAKAGPAARRAR